MDQLNLDILYFQNLILNQNFDLDRQNTLLKNIKQRVLQIMNLDRPPLLRNIGIFSIMNENEYNTQKNLYINDINSFINSFNNRHYLDALQNLRYAQSRLLMLTNSFL